MCFLWWTTQRDTCCMLGAELFNSVKENTIKLRTIKRLWTVRKKKNTKKLKRARKTYVNLNMFFVQNLFESGFDLEVRIRLRIRILNSEFELLKFRLFYSLFCFLYSIYFGYIFFFPLFFLVGSGSGSRIRNTAGNACKWWHRYLLVSSVGQPQRSQTSWPIPLCSK